MGHRSRLALTALALTLGAGTTAARDWPLECWRLTGNPNPVGEIVPLPTPRATYEVAARLVAALTPEQRAVLPKLRIEVRRVSADAIASCATREGGILLNEAAIKPDPRFGQGLEAAVLAHQIGRILQGSAGQTIKPPLDTPPEEVERMMARPRIAADRFALELLSRAEFNPRALNEVLAIGYRRVLGSPLAEYGWRLRLAALWRVQDAEFDQPLPKEAERVLERLSGGPKV